MRVTFAGGVGEHGRNCFLVEGETLSRQLELAGWPGDGSVAHLEGLEVDGVLAPLSLKLMPGNVVGLAGPVGPRTGAALALTGRLEATGGRARVAGELLPQAAGRVRRATCYVDLTLVQDVEAAIRRQDPQPGSVVVVDGVEAAGTQAELAAVHELAQRTRSEQTFALVLCGTTREHVEIFNLDGVVSPAILEGSNA